MDLYVVQFLKIVKEVNEPLSKVSNDDIMALERLRKEASSIVQEQDPDATTKNVVSTDFSLQYIDFMIEVKVGRKRNTIDRLAMELDNLDTSGTRRVPLKSVMKSFDRLPMDEFVTTERRQHLEFQLWKVKDCNDCISTVQVLELVGKEVSRQGRDSVWSLPSSSVVILLEKEGRDVLKDEAVAERWANSVVGPKSNLRLNLHDYESNTRSCV